MSEPITSHTWRPPMKVTANPTPWEERPCAFMSCGRPAAEHARLVTKQAAPPAVDWTKWRKCPVCAARTGQACWQRSGYGPDGLTVTATDRPHGGRQPRTGGN